MANLSSANMILLHLFSLKMKMKNLKIVQKKKEPFDTSYATFLTYFISRRKVKRHCVKVWTF